MLKFALLVDRNPEIKKKINFIQKSFHWANSNLEGMFQVEYSIKSSS